VAPEEEMQIRIANIGLRVPVCVDEATTQALAAAITERGARD
jgi:hypothetical protein